MGAHILLVCVHAPSQLLNLCPQRCNVTCGVVGTALRHGELGTGGVRLFRQWHAASNGMSGVCMVRACCVCAACDLHI